MLDIAGGRREISMVLSREFGIPSIVIESKTQWSICSPWSIDVALWNRFRNQTGKAKRSNWLYSIRRVRWRPVIYIQYSVMNFKEPCWIAQRCFFVYWTIFRPSGCIHRTRQNIFFFCSSSSVHGNQATLSYTLDDINNSLDDLELFWGRSTPRKPELAKAGVQLAIVGLVSISWPIWFHVPNNNVIYAVTAINAISYDIV